MKEQIDNAINWLMTQDIDGCLTGSVLLDYFEGQDIDVFTYNEQAFTKLIYAMYHNKLFLLPDKIEKWKFDDWTSNPYKGSIKKLGLVTIKFKYNTCVDVNVIFKEKNKSIFDVLSTFDMDIIAKGIDLKTKQTLDLTGDPGKIASWNKWNTAFYQPNLWSIGRILRQFSRCVKYHRRSYQTDSMVLKYKQMLVDIMEYDNIFDSAKVDEKVDLVKTNGKILIAVFDKWLETHEVTPEEIDLINKTIKNL